MTGDDMLDKDLVLVTGSGGRIGRQLLAALAGRYRVIGADRDPQPDAPPGVETMLLDVADAASVDAALQRVRSAFGTRIASVVHLAAYHDFTGAPSPLYDEVTVRGTERLLRGLRADFTVEQLVFSSTMLVHAPTQPGRPLVEDDPLAATWEYPRSKIATEELLRDERGDIPVVSLRIAGVYTDECDSIPIAAQIERILEKPIEGHVFPGDVTHGQAFVHMDDAIDAIVATVVRRRQLPRDFVPILIGEPHTYSYDTLQTEFARLLRGEQDWQTHEFPTALVKAVTWLQDRLPGTEPLVKPWMIDRADDHYELDISRASELLGWQPRHDLLETLPKMVRALAQDPEAWAERNGLSLKPKTIAKVKGRQP